MPKKVLEVVPNVTKQFGKVSRSVPNVPNT